MISDEQRQLLDRMAREMVDRGKLIECGWLAMRIGCDGYGLAPGTINAMRIAYLAGAQHLFSSIFQFLEPGTEPTENDERRLDLISAELEAAALELEAWTEGAIRKKWGESTQ